MKQTIKDAIGDPSLDEPIKLDAIRNIFKKGKFRVIIHFEDGFYREYYPCQAPPRQHHAP